MIEATPGNGYAVTAIAVNGEAKTPVFEERKGKVTLTAEEGQNYTVTVTFKKRRLQSRMIRQFPFIKDRKRDHSSENLRRSCRWYKFCAGYSESARCDDPI